MTALDVLLNVLNKPCLTNYEFRYCLVNENKLPFTINNNVARPNHNEDFCTISELVDAAALQKNLDLTQYRSLGISIQASNICAIDIDNCVRNKFDVNSINKLAYQIIKLFTGFAYIEFSFSGNGIRILFKAKEIKDYDFQYYTKNSNLHLEFYRPQGSSRYVTLTGHSIYTHDIESNNRIDKILETFLETYMKRKVQITKQTTRIEDNRSLEDLLKVVKLCYLKDFNFQELWFNPAPGSGSNESERDYHLVAYLYENVTKDKEKLRLIFEQSKFFKTKDYKHMSKWTKSGYRYFNYLYEIKSGLKGE